MSRMITVTSLPPGLSIIEMPAPAAPTVEIQARIDRIWDEEQKQRGTSLKNGSIFSVSRRDGAVFRVWETQYKWWIAQRGDPTLFEALAICPLAVTGVIQLADGLVFARRAPTSTQDAGLWELPPSGGVETACRRPDGIIAADAQLFAELEEELAVPPTALAAPPQPIAVMNDAVDHVVDIVFVLQVALSGAELAQRFAIMTNREYTALGIFGLRDAPQLLAREGGRLSPACEALLGYLSSHG